MWLCRYNKVKDLWEIGWIYHDGIFHVEYEEAFQIEAEKKVHYLNGGN